MGENSRTIARVINHQEDETNKRRDRIDEKQQFIDENAYRERR